LHQHQTHASTSNSRLSSSSCGSSASPMLARCRSYPRKLGDGPQHTRGVPSRQQSGSQTRTRVCATAHALAHKNDHIYILRLRRLVSSRAAENCAGGVGQQPRTCVPRLTLSPMYIAPSPPREQPSGGELRRRRGAAAWHVCALAVRAASTCSRGSRRRRYIVAVFYAASPTQPSPTQPDLARPSPTQPKASPILMMLARSGWLLLQGRAGF
jgi:hypothetical protein